jgi:hypothetical protein
MRSWKKLALLAILAAVALLAAPVPEIAVAPEGTSAGTRLATLSATALAQPSPPILPFCGDLCWTPGQERGCIDASQGHWRRVLCTCSGGSWAC